MFKITHIPYNIETYKKLIYTVNNQVKDKKDKIAPFYNDLVLQLNNYYINEKNLENLEPLKNWAVGYDLTPPLNGFQRNDSHTQLYNLYDTNIQLKKGIKRHTVGQLFVRKGLVCPYCGIKRNYTRDLDHYIPRSKYPEFSIMTNNLIFSCPTCNQDYKGDLFVDKNKNRFILNPYFDDCLEDEILKCKINNYGINLHIIFSIDPKLKNKNKNAYITACYHLKKLKLKDRYLELCMDLKDLIIESFCDPTIKQEKRIRVFTEEEIQDEIDRDIRRIIRTSHPNNFELIFLKELKKCTEWFSAISGQTIK
jgi:hypothetical protein